MSDHRSSERPASGSVPRTPRYADRGDGWTLAMELLTATFMWGGVGWLADRWLDTAPVLMVLGFVLGNALGVYLIWVRSQDRFTREHTELMARRARTRTVAQGVAPSAPEAARRPEPTPDVVASDGAPPSQPAPDAAVDDDEIVAPIHERDRRD
jgi:F0F1-type ATP synthase assembly protein I